MIGPTLIWLQLQLLCITVQLAWIMILISKMINKKEDKKDE